jgi:LCP family protein required for cell wall assembly
MSLIESKDKMFSVSAMMDDSISLFLQDQLDTQITQYKWDVVSDDSVNMQKLYEKKTDVMVLDNSMRDALIEQEPNFETETRIIYTVEKSSVKEDIVKKIKTSKQPFIVLISGIDVAGPIANKSRSDVNILMVVNPVTHKILTVSIPRDTYVNLGCKTGALDKLTHAGNFGISCTVKTIEKLMEIDINYYIRVNFSSVIKIINVIGDIQVYSKYKFTHGDFHFNVGMNTLNAEETLGFSRERYSFPSGDIQRGLNQQEVIKGMINKLVQPASLLKFDAIVNATSKSFDTNLSISDFSALIKKQIENNRPWEITTSNLSGKGDMMPTYSMGKRLLYVMHPNPESLAKIKTDIASYMTMPQ